MIVSLICLICDCVSGKVADGPFDQEAIEFLRQKVVRTSSNIKRPLRKAINGIAAKDILDLLKQTIEPEKRPGIDAQQLQDLADIVGLFNHNMRE